MSITTNSKLDVLGRQGWLSYVSPEFREAVLSQLVLKEFNGSTYVYRFGDAPDGLWGLIGGGVRVESPNISRIPATDHFSTPGFWFGDIAAICETTRKVGVMTTQRSTLALLPLSALMDLLNQDPSRWRWVAMLSAISAIAAIGVATDLLIEDPRTRVIATLLRLGGVRHTLFVQTRPVDIELSQDALAKICNVSRTLVSEVLGDLERSGFVRIGYRSISISDAQALSARLTNGSHHHTLD
ncbi:MAG: Crp/Fnr family transcriptional regulator [Xanthobacteraceae bacterium]